MPVKRGFVPRHRWREYVQVGQVFWTADEIRSLMRRVDGQWRALKRAVDATPRGRQDTASADAPFPDDPLPPEWRRSFAEAFQAWTRFRYDTCVTVEGDPCAELRGGLLAQAGWGGTVDQAQDYERDLQRFREQYTEYTGREVAGPESTAAERGREASRSGSPSGSALQTTLRVGFVAAAIVAVSWAVVEVAKRAPVARRGDDE